MQLLYLLCILKAVQHEQHDAHDSLEPHDKVVCANGMLNESSASIAIASLYEFTSG